MALPGSKRPASVLEELQEADLLSGGPTPPIRIKFTKASLFFKILCEWCMKRAKKYADLDRGLRKVSYARLQKKAEEIAKYIQMQKLPDDWIQCLKEVHGAVMEPFDIQDELPIPSSRLSWTTEENSVTSSQLVNSSQLLGSDDEDDDEDEDSYDDEIVGDEMEDDDEDEDNDSQISTVSATSTESQETLEDEEEYEEDEDMATAFEPSSDYDSQSSSSQSEATTIGSDSSDPMPEPIDNIDTIPEQEQEDVIMEDPIPVASSSCVQAQGLIPNPTELLPQQNNNEDELDEDKENNKYQIPICRWSIKSPYRRCLLLTHEEYENEIGDYSSDSESDDDWGYLRI